MFHIIPNSLIARSAYCCLCLVVSEYSRFISPNRRLFSTVGNVFRRQEAALLRRSLTWLCFCTTWLYVKLLYLWRKVPYHGVILYIATCYLLDMYTCMYMYMYPIKMSRTVDCVHEIPVYRYHFKIMYRDITSIRTLEWSVNKYESMFIFATSTPALLNATNDPPKA